MDTSKDSLIGRYSGSLVETMQDHRVAAVLSGPMADRLSGHIRANFIEWFHKVLESGEFEFEGFPDDVKADVDSAEQAARFIEMEFGELQQVSVSAVAGLIGDFVLQNRDAIVEAMKAAGEAPGTDRGGVVSQATGIIDDSRAKVEALAAAGSLDAAEEQVEEIRDRLEQARETIGLVIMDDAILFGASPDSASAVEGLPAVSASGRRVDVEELLLKSWMIEVDAHVTLANMAGEPLDYSKVAPEEQRQFILDAVVAIQEAITIRPDPDLILRFGELRLAKGDVGEARAAARKLLEVVEDQESELYVKASELLAAVEQASPLGKHDKRCFIATAAMGDIDAPQVQMLRDFRDEVLLESVTGRAFVDLYYRVSPPVARFISGRPALRAALRHGVIRPAVWTLGHSRALKR